MDFTFFWLDGKREVGRGTNVAKAWAALGHPIGAMKGVDFYMPGDNQNYEYNNTTRLWDRKPNTLEALLIKMDSGFYVP